MGGRLLSRFRRSARDPLGPKGERLARRYLRRRRYRVILKNAVTPVGEADIVCLAPDRETIVLVEVKTRRLDPAAGDDAIPPEASITAAKQRKMVQVLRWLASKHGWHERRLRIDVVAVECPPRGRPVIRHHEAALRP